MTCLDIGIYDKPAIAAVRKLATAIRQQRQIVDFFVKTSDLNRRDVTHPAFAIRPPCSLIARTTRTPSVHAFGQVRQLAFDGQHVGMDALSCFAGLASAPDAKGWLIAWDDRAFDSFVKLPVAARHQLLQKGVSRAITAAAATGLQILLRTLDESKHDAVIPVLLDTVHQVL